MKTTISLPATLTELQKLDTEAIFVLWRRYFPTTPQRLEYRVIRTLWYRIQCETRHLRIEQKHITRLNKYAADPDKHIEKAHKLKYHLRSGTEILKTFKGIQHKVLVRSDTEFIYQGQSYKTLSAVAMAICHKKVSGYDFFGLGNKYYTRNMVEGPSDDMERDSSQTPAPAAPTPSPMEDVA